MKTSHLFAKLYDIVMRPIDRAGLVRHRARLAHGLHGRVLEIGAGTGLEFAHYAADVNVIAIEPDVAMIPHARERAREAAAKVTLVIADAEHLPFRDGAFDDVAAALTFCTIPDPRRAVDEVRRVLAPGGRVRLLEHVRAHSGSLAHLQHWLTPAWKHVAGGCHLDRDTAGLFRQSGFTVETRRSRYAGMLVDLEARIAR